MTTNNLPTNPNYSQLPAFWTSSSQGKKNVNAAVAIVRTKHGMLASVPIVCKGRSCPYFQTCWIPENDLQVGERCPIEIAAIVERFEQHCQALNINPETDIVDAGLVRDIVDIEVMMLRADSLLATSGEMIEEVIAVVSNTGKEYYKPELAKATELKQSLRQDKMKILKELNATRKENKLNILESQDPSSLSARIIAKVKRLEEEGVIIDVTPDDTQPDQGEVKVIEDVGTQ